MSDLPPLPADIVATCNAQRGPFNKTLGIEFVSVSYDEIVADIPVTPDLHQPYGIVHGGVYCTIVETLASTGAALNAMARGQHAVGLENNTSFLRAVRGGRLRAVATPLTRGRRSHVWTVTITDDADRPVATGRVRMLCLESDSTLAGQSVAVQTDPR
jgi:1,4-dihydroxy-2-naphthoyl-CoA hydrolase